MDYKEAGVNIQEGYRAVEKYLAMAESTSNSAVLNGIGSFAGMFSLKEFLNIANGTEILPMEEPVLVSGTDGVGTKLDIAFRMEKYDTVGIDCVAMCLNDILCHGARPLFFLDYLACGKLNADIAAEIVKGIATGCRETGTVLLGGETAEMPGFYEAGKYDIAGFAVGIADRKKIINGSRIVEGHSILGIASSGIHSNGFSLIRKIIPDLNENFSGTPIGRVFLEPTRLYVKPVLELMKEVEILGMANITGGGFYENVPRMFYNDASCSGAPRLAAVIRDPLNPGYKGGWEVPPVFARIAYGIKSTGVSADSIPAKSPDVSLTGAAAQKAGEEILRTDPDIRKLMFNTYNMGIGFVLALASSDIPKAVSFLEKKGFPAWEIGRVEKSLGSAAELRFE